MSEQCNQDAKLVFYEQHPKVLFKWLLEAEKNEDTFQMALYWQRLLTIRARGEQRSFMCRPRCPIGVQRFEEMLMLVRDLPPQERLPFE